MGSSGSSWMWAGAQYLGELEYRARPAIARMKPTKQTWFREYLQRHVYNKQVKVLVNYALVFVVVVLYVLYRLRNRIPNEVVLPDDVDLMDYEPFEPDINDVFESDRTRSAKIPKIIHQTWKDTEIPPKFVTGIKSFVENNPDWEYYLWTDDSARRFVIDKYPSLIGLFNGFAYKNDKIRVADAIRYVVLYHFGGVYADMDVLNFRSLNGAITKHGCVLMPEPFEQAVLRGGVPFFINNAVMMCRPRHPFFKHLIDHLVDFEVMRTVWDSTGPGYLTFQYKMYYNLSREKGEFILYMNRSLEARSESSPYFYQGNVPSTDNRYVYIANSQYFLVTLDDTSFPTYYRWCLKFHELTVMWKRSCVNMKRKGLQREISPYAFTDHKWHFTYGSFNFFYYLPIYSFFTSTKIDDIVPHYKIYGDHMME